MVMQIFLTLALILILIYCLMQKYKILILLLFQMIIIFMGLYFVWFPSETTTIAHLVGVGRGSDLITYIWIVISLLLLLSLQYKILYLQRQLFFFAQKFALNDSRLYKQFKAKGFVFRDLHKTIDGPPDLNNLDEKTE